MLRDELTGLPGRELLEDRLEHALARARRDGPVGVMVIEIDEFEVLRTELGPDATDELLAELAPRLSAALESTDTLARTDGGEFVALCEAGERDGQLTLIADRLLAAAASHFSLAGEECFVKLSIGVTASAGGDDASEALAAAREALARARNAGGGRYELDPALGGRLSSSEELEPELRRAVSEGELRLYYQPAYSLGDGMIGSVEALLRWEHPERGIVAPGEFLEAIERSEVMVELGRWTIEEACRQLAAWRPSLEAAELYLAVNVNAEQLVRGRLTDHVTAAAERCGAPISSLALEMSVKDLEAAPAEAIASLRVLGEAGTGLVVDQLDSGRLPLERVEGLALRALKIAPALIAGLPDDARCTALARNAIEAGRELGIETIAQGVETPGQLEALRELSCDSVAGFLLSVPMPADAVEDTLRGSVRLLEAGALSPAEGETDAAEAAG